MKNSNAQLVSLRRRSFLQTLGISGAVSLVGCERLAVEESLPLLQGDAHGGPGESVRYASTCLGCPSSCGVLVTVRDGRPIKLEGLEDHPRSRGGLCAQAQASVRGLYDAGRLRKPSVNRAEADDKAVDAHVASRLAKAHGKVAVLTSTVVGASMQAALQAFADTHGATVVEYDASLGAGAGVLAAYAMLDGRSRYPAVDLAGAEVWLSVGGDPIGTGAESVAMARQLAERRRARKGGADFRHLHLEGNLSLTGAGADVRVRATAAERTLFVAQVLARVAAKSGHESAERVKRLTQGLPALAGHEQKIASVAAELAAKNGRAVVTSGSRLPLEQLLVAMLNRMLGAEGSTIRLEAALRTQRGRDEAVASLLAKIQSGAVSAVVIVDINPVEQLPGGDALAAKLKSMTLSVAVTSRPTGTADACQVVVAAHHELERWSDTSPQPGVHTIAQPTLRPLFSTRDPLEAIVRWTGKNTGAQAYVKATWAGLGVKDADWDETLSQGMASEQLAAAMEAARAAPADDGEPGSEASLAKMFKGIAAPADGLEVELLEEVGVGDGRASYNPWLRELPDPLTRSSWVAAARISPALAASKGVANGDILTIGVGDQTVEMQAVVLPGQHDRVVGVPVGYGVKDGDGGKAIQNGYRLAALNAEGLRTAGLGATVARKGSGADLPLMQWEGSTHGRPIIHQVETDDEKIDAGHHSNEVLWGDDRQYSPHWHMVIDLDSCTGCSACVVACQAENNIPVVGPKNMTDHRDMHWLRMDRYFVGAEDDPEIVFEPMLCAQCDNAPCETVCPVAATVHSHDGLNMQAYNRCVGTRYCANNCPYKVRRFNWFDFTPTDELQRLVLNPDVVVRDRGVMEKCTFCVQRIQAKRIHPDSEPVQTACQQSCPAKAISFGDRAGDDHIQEQLHEPRAFQVLADLGVLPSITYLARVRRRDPKTGKGT
jgi:Fe-S-cluster-containing dehydrogenase component/anaerobic selenocysteine-containing dehydrogenase